VLADDVQSSREEKESSPSPRFEAYYYKLISGEFSSP
jgi:hypothetical protein